jgi:cysteine synthase
VAKLEYLKPASSVKDRIAKAMIEKTEGMDCLRKIEWL